MYNLSGVVGEIGLTPAEFREAIGRLPAQGNVGRRERQLLTMLKILTAVRLLTSVLGHPPSMKQIAEAVDQPYKRVWRILRTEKARLMLSLLEKDAEELKLQKVQLSPGVTGFRWRLDWRRCVEPWAGGPSRVYAYVRAPDPLTEIPMTPSEREKLSKYLTESFFIDLCKTTMLKLSRFCSGMIPLWAEEPYLTAVHSFYSSIGRRVLEVARREGVKVTGNIEEYLNFDWILSITKLDDHALQELQLSLSRISEGIPDEEWRTIITSPSVPSGYLTKKGPQIFLKCGICASRTPHRKFLESFECSVCGTQYDREKS